MPRAKSLRFRRLLAGSTGPSKRCNRRCKFCVRIRNGSAFSSRDSIRQTAAFGGRAGKKSSSARAASKSSLQSSSSTKREYYGQEKLVLIGASDGNVLSKAFHCQRINLKLAATVSRIASSSDSWARDVSS